MNAPLPSIKSEPRTRMLAIVICLLIVTIDGFDVFVMGLTMPHLPEGFISDDTVRGVLLSASLFGMAAGAIVLAPLADLWGRRRVVILSLMVTVAGMVLSGFAVNAAALIVWRILTGIGVGTMATSLMVLVQEHSSVKNRTLVFGVYSLGFPAGSAIGGATGLAIMNALGGEWHAMFFFGGALSSFALIAAWLWLPEAREFPSGGVVDPQATDSGTAASAVPTAGNAAIRGLFVDGKWRTTLLLWLAYASLMLAFYFVSTWTPQLVMNATGDAHAGTTAGVVLSWGSFVGAGVFALVSLRVDAARLMWIGMALGAVCMLGLSYFFGSGSLLLVLAALLGVFSYVAITASATLIPPRYAPGSRVTASGWMVGVGRLCSIAAPMAVGVALAHVEVETLYALAAVPLVVGMVATLGLARSGRRVSIPA